MQSSCSWRVFFTSGIILLFRPYIRREWPGWGWLYRSFVGSFERDSLWTGHPVKEITGKLHGYRIRLRIDGWSNRFTYFLERYYDLPTQRLLIQYLQPGSQFVDIGANEGMMSLLASRLVGADGSVTAFEPNPEPAGYLDESIRINGIDNITLRREGVGDVPGTLELFIPDHNSGEGTFTAVEGQKGHKHQAAIVVGDTVLQDQTPSLIKIDVEGFEAHVIRGLEKTIARAAPIIVMEMIAAHLARDNSAPADLIAMLEDHGYVGYQLALVRKGMRHQLQLCPRSSEWRDGDYAWFPKSASDDIPTQLLA